ncbi:MAG: band-7 C-terminal domain-containing protein, partial [Sutterella sp.]
EEGGMNAVNLQVAEKYVEAFSQLAKTGNTLIVPGNLGDMSTLISSAMKIVDGVKSQNSALPPKA